MYLEVLNPLFGYTKGSITEALIQVRIVLKGSSGEKHIIFVIKAHKICR